jgi:homoserine dehydrogenase
VAIAGFGMVGSAVAKILTQQEYAQLFRITHVLNRRIAEKRVAWIPEDVIWTEAFEEVLASDVDIVVELIGGLTPAGDWVKRALAAGKSVVTANKQLIAAEGLELSALARAHRAHLAFGASVAGGIPVLSGLQGGLAGDRLAKVSGILNGTCNYILTRVESEGVSFAQALAEAQRAGFAEADPSSDVDGADARAKIVILARVALRAHIEPEEVVCRSIRPISAADFCYAHELGCTIRQIASAAVHDNVLHTSVQPMLVGRNSPYARVDGAQNLVVSTGCFGGETSFSGTGAGGGPTAVAVVSDLVAIAGSEQVPATSAPPALRRFTVSADTLAAHYTRFLVNDRPGILAKITAVFAEHGMNVDAVLQLPGFSKQALPFAITVEPCSQLILAEALHQLRALEFMIEPPLCMPFLERTA